MSDRLGWLSSWLIELELLVINVAQHTLNSSTVDVQLQLPVRIICRTVWRSCCISRSPSFRWTLRRTYSQWASCRRGTCQTGLSRARFPTRCRPLLRPRLRQSSYSIPELHGCRCTTGFSPVASSGFWSRGGGVAWVFTKSGRNHRNLYLTL